MAFLFGGAALFDFLFWSEKPGINLFLFTVFLVVLMWEQFEQSKNNLTIKMMLILSLFSSAMVAILNTNLTIVVYFITIGSTIGFVHQPAIRSFYIAGIVSFLDAFPAIIRLLMYIRQNVDHIKQVKIGFSWLSVAIIPLIIFLIFLNIYLRANPVFNQFSFSVFSDLIGIIEDIFRYYTLPHFFFTFLGFCILAWIIFKLKDSRFVQFDTRSKMDLEEQSPQSKSKKEDERLTKVISKLEDSGPGQFDPETIRKRKEERLSKKQLSIIKERKAGIILLVSNNILLMVVNIIDFQWVWLGNNIPSAGGLSQFVHSGTYLLIFSILLSIGIMIYLFKGSQNFVKEKKWLQYAAYAWIVQNAFMVISVGLRNYHYIDYFGLSHKRVGVLVFLFLTLVGLITLVWKIQKVRTFYYLVNVNSWAFYFTLILLSLISWDALIANHNIKADTKAELDIWYLYHLSDNVLPVIIKNKGLIKKKMRYSMTFEDWQWYRDRVADKKEEYLEKQESYSWRSWNFSDHKIKRTMKEL